MSSGKSTPVIEIKTEDYVEQPQTGSDEMNEQLRKLASFIRRVQRPVEPEPYIPDLVLEGDIHLRNVWEEYKDQLMVVCESEFTVDLKHLTLKELTICWVIDVLTDYNVEQAADMVKLDSNKKLEFIRLGMGYEGEKRLNRKIQLMLVFMKELPDIVCEKLKRLCKCRSVMNLLENLEECVEINSFRIFINSILFIFYLQPIFHLKSFKLRKLRDLQRFITHCSSLGIKVRNSDDIIAYLRELEKDDNISGVVHFHIVNQFMVKEDENEENAKEITLELAKLAKKAKMELSDFFDVLRLKVMYKKMADNFDPRPTVEAVEESMRLIMTAVISIIFGLILASISARLGT